MLMMTPSELVFTPSLLSHSERLTDREQLADDPHHTHGNAKTKA
jgi:hypothetical protein